MTTPIKEAPSTIIPAMRYRNAPAAIEWLCQAFGFEKHLVVPGENGTIAHAQLTLGSGMMMLGSIRDNDFSKLIKQPDDLAGVETQRPYVVVKDPDAHYAGRWRLVQRSSVRLRTPVMAVAVIPAATWRAISGALAATIPGPSRTRLRLVRNSK